MTAIVLLDLTNTKESARRSIDSVAIQISHLPDANVGRVHRNQSFVRGPFTFHRRGAVVGLNLSRDLEDLLEARMHGLHISSSLMTLVKREP